MSIEEFLARFDVQYNNITSNQAPALNPYEISVFLTKGQDETIKNHFSPKGNPHQDGFDDTPKRQADFSSIIRTVSLNTADMAVKFDPRSFAYIFPTDVFISLNEQLTVASIPYTVVPISYEDYSRLMCKPYKYPPKYQAWRLITGNREIVPEASETFDVGGTDYTCRICNKYSKPVRFILIPRNSEGAEVTGIGDLPVVSETETVATITCKLVKGSQSSSYWSNLLLNSATNSHAIALGSPNLEPYIGKFTGENGDSLFPSFTVPDINTALIDITAGVATSTNNTVVEIIGKFSVAPSYRLRYIKKPHPIILEDLSADNLSIDGYTAPMTSELPEQLHEEILQRAVELAKVAWTSTGNDNVQLELQAGQRSE